MKSNRVAWTRSGPEGVTPASTGTPKGRDGNSFAGKAGETDTSTRKHHLTNTRVAFVPKIVQKSNHHSGALPS